MCRTQQQRVGGGPGARRVVPPADLLHSHDTCRTVHTTLPTPPPPPPPPATTDGSMLEAKTPELTLKAAKVTDCKLVIVEGTRAQTARTTRHAHARVITPPPTHHAHQPMLLATQCTGNISAGKSTLCRTLADELGYVLYLEPTVRAWQYAPPFDRPRCTVADVCRAPPRPRPARPVRRYHLPSRTATCTQHT